MARIEIDHLEIRVKNISRDTIDSIVEELGPTILDRLDNYLYDSGAPSTIGGPMMIDRLDAGVVSGGIGPAPHDLRDAIAESIVRTITGSIQRPRSGSDPEIRGGENRGENVSPTGSNGTYSRSVSEK